MPFPCPACRKEIDADGDKPICAACGRMWRVTANFLEGVRQAEANEGAIHSICWRHDPGDGLGQFGVAALHFVLNSIVWGSLPLAAFLVIAGIGTPFFEENSAVAAACVAAFATAALLLRRVDYFTRGAMDLWPTLVVSERGLYDVVSFQDVFYVPWYAVTGTIYVAGLLSEELWINFATKTGPQSLHLVMDGGLMDKPLADTTAYVEARRGRTLEDEPFAAIHDSAEHTDL